MSDRSETGWSSVKDRLKHFETIAQGSTSPSSANPSNAMKIENTNSNHVKSKAEQLERVASGEEKDQRSRSSVIQIDAESMQQNHVKSKADKIERMNTTTSSKYSLISNERRYDGKGIDITELSHLVVLAVVYPFATDSICATDGPFKLVEFLTFYGESKGREKWAAAAPRPPRNPNALTNKEIRQELARLGIQLLSAPLVVQAADSSEDRNIAARKANETGNWRRDPEKEILRFFLHLCNETLSDSERMASDVSKIKVIG